MLKAYEYSYETPGSESYGNILIATSKEDAEKRITRGEKNIKVTSLREMHFSDVRLSDLHLSDLMLILNNK